jgi:hypothetical protein
MLFEKTIVKIYYKILIIFQRWDKDIAPDYERRRILLELRKKGEMERTRLPEKRATIRTPPQSNRLPATIKTPETGSTVRDHS